MSLAKRVRDCRYSKGWGPDELAVQAEISRTALYQIECGKTELPRAGTLRRIAKALEVPIDVLLGEAEINPIDLTTFATGPSENGTNVPRKRGRPRLHIDESTFAQAPPRRDAFLAQPSPREQELIRKFRELLPTAMGEAVAKLVEDSHQLLLSHGGN